MSVPVLLTPRGTRGSKVFQRSPWQMAILSAVNVAFYRLIGRRIGMQGRPLLLLDDDPPTDREISVVRLVRRP